MWLNSLLPRDRQISTDLGNDLRDGYALLNALDIILPGSVDVRRALKPTLGTPTQNLELSSKTVPCSSHGRVNVAPSLIDQACLHGSRSSSVSCCLTMYNNTSVDARPVLQKSPCLMSSTLRSGRRCTSRPSSRCTEGRRASKTATKRCWSCVRRCGCCWSTSDPRTFAMAK